MKKFVFLISILSLGISGFTQIATIQNNLSCSVYVEVSISNPSTPCSVICTQNYCIPPGGAPVNITSSCCADGCGEIAWINVCPMNSCPSSPCTDDTGCIQVSDHGCNGYPTTDTKTISALCSCGVTSWTVDIQPGNNYLIY